MPDLRAIERRAQEAALGRWERTMKTERSITAYARPRNKCIVSNCEANTDGGMFCRKCSKEMYAEPVDVNKQTILFVGVVILAVIFIVTLIKCASGL